MPQLKKTLVAALTTFLSSTAIAAPSQSAEAPPAKILFVCEHGNVKSLMAASYFNQIAQERNLSFVAISRGVAPDSTTVPSAITAGLRQDGIDVSTFHPSRVTSAEVSSAERVITIGAPLPINIRNSHALSISWDDVPPASVDFDSSRTSLKAHIHELIKQLTVSEK